MRFVSLAQAGSRHTVKSAPITHSRYHAPRTALLIEAAETHFPSAEEEPWS